MSNPTSNYSFQMPTSTDLVTDLPADFEVFGQAVDTQMKTNADAATQKSTLTTKGDIYAATAASTPARLAVGTDGHAIVADSTASTGLAYKNIVPSQTGNSGKYLTTDGSNTSWGALAAGGMTLISTTTLSGASVTLSSIPQTYKSLAMYVKNYQPATNGQLLRFRYNSDAGANRYGTNDLGVSVSGTFNGTSMYAQIEQNSTTANGFSYITMFDYTNTTTWKYANVFCVSNNQTTSTTPMLGSYWAIYNQTSAISSITLFANSGNLTAGTVLLYGVA